MKSTVQNANLNVKNIRILLQQIAISCVVVWLWRTFEGDANRRWDETYAVADNAVVEIVAANSLQQISEGTGFVVTHANHVVIVTNEHVVHGAKYLKLRFKDSTIADGELLDSSIAEDLAAVRAKGVNLARYSPLLPSSSPDLHIGEELLTIGHPLRESHHISIGLYTGREKLKDLGPMLRLNMPVDPGNSGGPLLNNRGKVVGVVTLKESEASSIAFAIPIENLEKLRLP